MTRVVLVPALLPINVKSPFAVRGGRGTVIGAAEEELQHLLTLHFLFGDGGGVVGCVVVAGGGGGIVI
jgi:hypothetical protein